MAADNEPLDFSFIKEPPGSLINLDSHRIHVHCVGSGPVTVLFEPGLGGSAFEWQPIQDAVGKRVQACVYDRAGYGWSDPSPFRGDVKQLAKETDLILTQIADTNKLVLVGHSFGGFVVRMLTLRRPDQVIGMVLVDTSHEDQLSRMEKPGSTKILPIGNTFVMARPEVPANLPKEISRKIEAFSRMRKSYSATEREMRSFRDSIEQMKAIDELYAFPLKVLYRGLNPLAEEKDGVDRHRIWVEMQQSLAELSSDGEVIVGEQSGHHVHIDEPQLVIDALNDILDKAGPF